MDLEHVNYFPDYNNVEAILTAAGKKCVQQISFNSRPRVEGQPRYIVKNYDILSVSPNTVQHTVWLNRIWGCTEFSFSEPITNNVTHESHLYPLHAGFSAPSITMKCHRMCRD